MEHLEQRQKVIIMIAIMSAMFFAAINMTIVGTALPKIISQIGGMDYFDWVFTIYMLSSTITAMLVGRLSDIYGRKVFILIGIGVFMTGAFLSGTSDTIIQLIIYRGIQGFGGGMIMSAAFTTVGDLFSPRERGRWQGMFAGVFGLSSLFGPTLGGYIVDNFNWHWVFWIFLPIGFIAFFLIWKLYPTHIRQEKQSIDYLGSFVLTLVIISLLLGFSWGGNEYEWLSYQIIGLFSFTIIGLVVFIFIEKRVENPVIPLHLFKNQVFTLSNIAGLFLGMGMFGVIMYTPFFVQGVLGRTATVSGLVEMAMTISMVILSTIGGQLITKTGKYKTIALVGLVLMALGLFLNSLLHPDSSLLRLILQLIIIGMGLGMAMPVFQVTVQNAVKHQYLGVATSVMQVFRQIGGTIGVAVMGTILGQLMKNRLEEVNTQPASAPLPEEMNERLAELQNPQLLMDLDVIEEMRSSFPTEMITLFDQLILTMRDVLNYSLTGVFLFSAIIVTCGVVVTAFIKEIPLRTTNRDEDTE
ncbi:MDR family MFS transporter [Halalkalibacter urbisdiaboli]|uniref:MDR family MFS transporter n=1 Tax=Halalkalibacter urbisdiaboli TaxID=1960589 RepID=UPI000B442631|nr:MDR family MFS transporter [Halalkalibacter urbisdiaboli]